MRAILAELARIDNGLDAVGPLTDRLSRVVTALQNQVNVEEPVQETPDDPLPPDLRPDPEPDPQPEKPTEPKPEKPVDPVKPDPKPEPGPEPGPEPVPVPEKPEKPAPVPVEPADRHPIKSGPKDAGPIGLHRGSDSWTYDHLPADLAARLNPVKHYEIPTRSMCHWIVGDDGARSNDGGSVFIPRDSEGNVLKAIYRRHVELGKPLPCRIGVDTNSVGRGTFGGQWGTGSGISVLSPDGAGIRCEIVGLKEGAEGIISWSSDHGFVEHLGLYNMFLRGTPNHMAVLCNDKQGDIFLDGSVVLEDAEFRREYLAWGARSRYQSGLHFKNWRYFLYANADTTKGKYMDGGPENSSWNEHILYAKFSYSDGLDVFHNNFIGGNRTAVQIRPDGFDEDHPEAIEASHRGFEGNITFMGNRADGYGWDHYDGTGGSNGGGQVLTAWQCPRHDVSFISNEITDARYGCLGAVTQAEDTFYGGRWVKRNTPNPDGYSLKRVNVYGNKCSNPRASRGNSVFAGVQELHFYEGNDIIGPDAARGIVVDNEWAMEKHDVRSQNVILHPGAHDLKLMTFDKAQDKVVPLNPDFITRV